MTRLTPMMRLKEKDNGLNKLKKALGKSSIQVGILEKADDPKEGSKEGLTVEEVAAFHEFGLGVPERSFLRGWLDENKEKVKEALERMAEATVRGKYSKEQALELLGQKFVGSIQERISNRIPPPLADSTVKKKGSDVPLIDTGQLRASITYRTDVKE